MNLTNDFRRHPYVPLVPLPFLDRAFSSFDVAPTSTGAPMSYDELRKQADALLKNEARADRLKNADEREEEKIKARSEEDDSVRADLLSEVGTLLAHAKEIRSFLGRNSGKSAHEFNVHDVSCSVRMEDMEILDLRKEALDAPALTELECKARAARENFTQELRIAMEQLAADYELAAAQALRNE